MITKSFGRLWIHSASVIIYAMLLSSVMRLASSMCLTRILDPSAFGVVGVLSSITFVIAIVSDVGITPFVVRHADGESESFLNEVWSIRLIRSIALTALMMIAAKPLSIIMGKPELFMPIVAWSLIFSADGLASMSFATAIRRKQIFRLNFIDVFVLLVQTIIGVIAGLILRSYWAIIISVLLGAVSKTAMSYLWYSNSARSFSWSPARMKELWSFSRLITLSGLFSLILSQTDKLVLAKAMTLSQYGVYALAASLSALPLTFVGSYTHQVLYPAFVRQVSEHDLRDNLFYKPFMKPAIVYVISIGLFAGLAPLIINIMYDSRFSSAGIYLRILSFLPLCAIYTWSSDQFCIAFGRTGSILKAHIARVIWLVVVGYIGWMKLGPLGIVIAVGSMEIPAIIVYVFIRQPLGAFLPKKDIGLAIAASIAVISGESISNAANQSMLVPYIKHMSVRLIRFR